MLPSWLTHGGASVGIVLCSVVFFATLRDVAFDVYHGTGNKQWFGIAAGRLAVWGAMLVACVFELLR